MPATAIGIALMLVATALTNVGAAVQKQAVDTMPRFEQAGLRGSLRTIVRTRRWLIGWLLALAGIALNMVALGFADLSIIQPLNGFGLVVLAVVSHRYLGERLGARGMVGIAGVIGGVAWIGSQAPASRLFVAPGELVACYARWPVLAVLATPLLASLLVPWLARRRNTASAVALAGLAALCSVVGLVCAKGVFGLWRISGWPDAVTGVPSLLLLAALLTGSTLALAVQQLALQQGAAVLVVPVFAACSVALPLPLGRLVFDESMTPGIVLPTVLIVAGVVALGLRRGHDVADRAPR